MDARAQGYDQFQLSREDDSTFEAILIEIQIIKLFITTLKGMRIIYLADKTLRQGLYSLNDLRSKTGARK